MSETKTQQEFAAFLESLKVNNEGPEEMHGLRFDAKFDAWLEGKLRYSIPAWQACEYLLARTKRAESNAKPSDLAEQVKAFMLAGMDAEYDYHAECMSIDPEASPHGKLKICDEWRRLSEPGDI